MYSCVSGLSLLIWRVFCKHGIDESLGERRKTLYSLDIQSDHHATEHSRWQTCVEQVILQHVANRACHIKLCIDAPRARPLIDLSTEFVDFQSKPSLLCCRALHTFSSTISMGKKELKLGLKLGKELKRIPNKYGHICPGFFVTPSPTSPRYAHLTSTKIDLQK